MNIQNLMAQAKKVQGEMEKITKAIEETIFEYSSENVSIQMFGSNKVKKIEILNKDILVDKEILEDVLTVGINEVLEKIKKEKESKLGRLTGGMGGLF